MKLLAPTVERLEAVKEWAPILVGNADSYLLAGEEGEPYGVACLYPQGDLLMLAGPVTRLEGEDGQKVIDFLVECAKGIARPRNKVILSLSRELQLELRAAGFEDALVCPPGAERRARKKMARKKDHDDQG